MQGHKWRTDVRRYKSNASRRRRFMARIEGVKSNAGWFARFVYAMARKRLGKMPEPLAIQAHHGAIFKGNAAFEYALEHAKLVDHKLKALAEIKASSLIGCPW
jgi:hypothetical protein